MTFKVGRIDFINTAPIYHGLNTGRVVCPGEAVSGPPAKLNRMLAAGKIQISAISSVAYARAYPDWLLLPHLSISARGPVGSVLLSMKQPLENFVKAGRIGRVGLTDKSATSQALTRILLEDCHKLAPEYEEVDLCREVPADLDGLLLIGDDAFKLSYREQYPHIMDLGEFWVKWTGLPFVFGLWAVDRAFAEAHPADVASVVKALQASKELGLQSMGEAARMAAERAKVPEKICLAYLSHIQYDLAEAQLEGLTRFFEILKQRGEVDASVKPVLWTPAGRGACIGK